MLSRSEIIQEYARCWNDYSYVIETYYKTFDQTQKGFVPFKLFPKQKEIIAAYNEHRFNLVTKPRQAGVSTTTAAYAASLVGFADKENPQAVLILANKQDMAFEFLAKIKEFLLQLPRWVWGAEYYGSEENEKKSIFIKDSQKEISLPNKSRIKAVATSKDALRGYTPTFLIMDEAAFIDNGDVVFGAALTALGCLTKDSLILTDNGLVELDELVSEKEKLGFTNLDLPHMVCNKEGTLVPATQTFVSEYGETFKFKTKLGIELEGSWKHPILINRDGIEMWVRLNELSIGDKPVIQYGQNYFGSSGVFNYEKHIGPNLKFINIPSDLSENLDFSYLLGLFVAEGNFQSGGICITNIDEYIRDFLINDKAKLGNGFKLVDDRHHTFHSVQLLKWFEAFGLKKHNARDKEIPLALLRMPKNVIKAFLQGLFDGDGMSTYKDIKYSSTSKKLVKTLQTLLLNFGIISHVKKEVQKTSESSIIPNKSHICVIYNLKIYSNYAIKFYDEIGFRLERKQINRECLLNRKENSRYVNVNKETIETVLKDNNVPKVQVRFLERFWGSEYNRLSYESLKRLIKKIPNNKILLDLYLQISENDKFYIDEIVQIDKSEDYTYDLHVPITNSFISNGIISHNTGGKATLISTPNGLDSLYYKTYSQSKSGKNNFNVIEMKWYEDLRYNKDLKWIKGDELIEDSIKSFENNDKMLKDGYKPTSSWYEDMCKGMNNNAKMIAQELDVSFIGSGGNVIENDFIEFHEKENVQEPVIISGPEQEFWIWEEPIEGHQYLLAADVSRGDGNDYSTIEIIDFTTMTQVVEYQGKVPPNIFAQIIYEYGNRYKAYSVIDNIGVGAATILPLLEMDYKFLHYDDPKNKMLVDKRSFRSYDKGDKMAGFSVGNVRVPMVANFERAVRENEIIIRSARLTNEMKTFVYQNGKPNHMSGYNDDLIMAMAMGLWVLEHSFKKLEKVGKQTKAMLSSWVMSSNVNTSNTGGFVPKELNGKSQLPKPNFSPTVSKNMQDPKGDYLWLFSGMK